MVDATSGVAFFHELDAWTEYWDVYHPESNGRYYFGNGDEPGLLELIVPRTRVPPIFAAWNRHALGLDAEHEFCRLAVDEDVAAATAELDDLVASIFGRHFGDPGDEQVRRSYLEVLHRFATDTLPPAIERARRVPLDDPRHRTAGRHTIDVDAMWFVWALELEAAQLGRPDDGGEARRALLLSGVAVGSAANFAWRGHRRTRPEYRADDATARLLLERGMLLAEDFEAAAAEVHHLFQIREWGVAGSPRP